MHMGRCDPKKGPMPHIFNQQKMGQYSMREAILKVTGIKKEFSGVYALSGISFDLYPGEIHCLVGENGAGKSTLMKILSGAYIPSEGEILFEGEHYSQLNPSLAKQLGISIVYQENDLVPAMNVIENVFVGNEQTKKWGFMDYSRMAKSTEETVRSLGIYLDLNCKIENMSVSDQQFVKIIKALSFHPRVLIMDEPTSMFNTEDSDKVLKLAQRIAEQGIGIIYISHFLNEVQQIADRVTVLRDGIAVKTYENKNRDIDLTVLANEMVGRPIDVFYQKEKNEIGEVILEVKDLRLKQMSPRVNFVVRSGEILGFAGMVGAGRTEIVRAITGADSKYSGEVLVHGKRVTIKDPADSIRYGFAHITEDRQKLGLMLDISVLENATIVGMHSKIKGFFINIRKHVDMIAPLIRNLNVKTPSIWTEARYLSGGNQQKVVLAKWLFTDQEVYIFDEPTRGIDINAKADFYREICKLTKQGKAVILISSDMPELISMSDRVLVIRDGEITSELTGEEITEQTIIRKALGV